MKEWLINREAVEERFGQPLTEEEWSAVTEEVAGRVENFIEEILDGVLEMKVRECDMCQTGYIHQHEKASK